MTVVNLPSGINVTGSTGSVGVYFDRSGPQIGGVTQSVAVYFDRANPAVSATFSGSVATYFDPSNPAVNLTSGTLTGITNSIAVYLGATAGTLGVRVGQVDETIAIRFSPSNPNVQANYGSGTFLVAFDRANPSVSIGGASSSIGVFFDRANPAVNLTSGTLTNITNTVGVYFDRSNPAVSANYGSGTFLVAFDRANPAVSANYGSGTFIVGFDSSKGFLQGINSSVAVYFDRANPTVSISDPFGTAIVFRTATGSASTAGNNTVVSPEASRSIKVFAYQLTTTAQVGIAPRFTTGASAGATELWRNALQAPTQGIAGANLAVTPPAYLFATGAGNTLALYIDSGSLVHYSVAYFKETA